MWLVASGCAMDLLHSLTNLLKYLAPDPYFVSSRPALRRYLLPLAILLTVAAIAGAVVLKPSRGSKPDTWDNFRHKIADRAEVDLFDDFRAGLDSWESDESLASTWSYDTNGFVNPGTLSVLTPSKHLTDYVVDALAQVENKGLGLAFRASGPRSYQAVKLLSDGAGPMPGMQVERYAVIAGKASQPSRIHCPARFRKDTLYNIHLEVSGDSFALYIQGQLIDSWSDARLGSGGVGFFCAKGERARVAWVRVSHHADTLGKLCSMVTPLL